MLEGGGNDYKQVWTLNASEKCLGCSQLQLVCSACFWGNLFSPTNLWPSSSTYLIDLALNIDKQCKHCNHYIHKQKCILQLHKLFEKFSKFKISKLLCFHNMTILLLSSALPSAQFALFAPASLPCGHPHCSYRLISELSPTQLVQKWYSNWYQPNHGECAGKPISLISSIFSIQYSCITPLFPRLRD